MENAIRNIQVDTENNAVTVAVNPEVYPLDVIYGASFVYIDRAYVMLDRAEGDEARVMVSLKARQPSDSEALEALGGSFANELLSQALRETIAKKTQKIRELVINRALYSTLDSGSSGDLDFDEDDDLDFLDDPLGIAVPWEEKFEGEQAEGEQAEGEQAEGEAAEATAEGAEPDSAATGDAEEKGE